MTLFDSLNPFKSSEKPLSSGTRIGISEHGKQRLENGDVNGNQSDILTYLSEHGPSTPYEIGTSLHKDPYQVVNDVKLMKNSQLVRVMA